MYQSPSQFHLANGAGTCWNYTCLENRPWQVEMSHLLTNPLTKLLHNISLGLSSGKSWRIKPKKRLKIIVVNIFSFFCSCEEILIFNIWETDAFMYVYGSAGTNSTCDANLKAFHKWAIIPRMLVDATPRNLKVSPTLFSFSINYSLPRIHIRTADDHLWRGISVPAAHGPDRSWRYHAPRCRTRFCTRSKDYRGTLHYEHSCF
jgi:hypothetical protein